MAWQYPSWGARSPTVDSPTPKLSSFGGLFLEYSFLALEASFAGDCRLPTKEATDRLPATFFIWRKQVSREGQASFAGDYVTREKTSPAGCLPAAFSTQRKLADEDSFAGDIAACERTSPPAPHFISAEKASGWGGGFFRG